MITIVNYGAGNLRSVENSLAATGAAFETTSDCNTITRATKLMLPGVGHFGQMMSALDSLGVREALISRVAAGVPLLGVCLGLQALFEASEEAPDVRGLGLLAGNVARFGAEARVPHMGWNAVERRATSQLLERDEYFYFAHSFYAPVGEQTTGLCDYSREFSAVVERDNIFGVQFHPEKSGASGLRVLRRFADL